MVVTHDTLQSAAEKEQFEIVEYLVKTCTNKVDIIGIRIPYVWNSLHIAAYIQRRMFKRFNVSSIITMEKTSKQSSIKRIVMDTPLDLHMHSNSYIKNEIVSLLRKYGGKAN